MFATYMQDVLMVTFFFIMGRISRLPSWRVLCLCATMIRMELYVMTIGMNWRPRLSVDNLDMKKADMMVCNPFAA